MRPALTTGSASMVAELSPGGVPSATARRRFAVAVLLAAILHAGLVFRAVSPAVGEPSPAVLPAISVRIVDAAAVNASQGTVQPPPAGATTAAAAAEATRIDPPSDAPAPAATVAAIAPGDTARSAALASPPSPALSPPATPQPLPPPSPSLRDAAAVETPAVTVAAAASLAIANAPRAAAPPVVGLPPAPDYAFAARLDPGPQPLDDITPEYPDGAEARSGSVVLRLLISDAGVVDDVAVVRATPAGVFERSALAAFSVARFAPGRLAGVPVKSQITIEVQFTPLNRGARVSGRGY